MKKLISFVPFLLFSLAVVSQSAENANVRLELEKANQVLEEAVAEGDQEKFLLQFADDATFKVSGQELLEGPEAILAAHQPLMAQGIELQLDIDEVLHFGNYAHMSGDYSLVAPNGQPIDQGKYATLFKKVNGEWKIFRDMTSSVAPPGGN